MTKAERAQESIRDMILESPEFKIFPKSGTWELTKRLVYFSVIAGEISVPVGFITDLASIPRIFRAIIPVNGKHRIAAIVHDFLYQEKGKLPHKNLSRKQCDEIFFEAMKYLDVPFWKRHLMYRAVRMGGWTYWNY